MHAILKTVSLSLTEIMCSCCLIRFLSHFYSYFFLSKEFKEKQSRTNKTFIEHDYASYERPIQLSEKLN